MIEPNMSPPDAPPGMTMIPNISLEKFERAVYSRNYEDSGRMLLDSLRKLKIGAEFIGYPPDPKIKKGLYTRFCAAVVALLSDPAFMLSQEGFNNIAGEHATMDLVFRASAFETSDHMLAQVSNNPGEVDRNKLTFADGPSLAKFMLTYSLRSGFSMNFEEAFGANRHTVFALWSGMISAMLTVHPAAQERLEQLVGMHGTFRDVLLPDAALPSLSDAYMYSSYALRRDKHQMKGTIHGMIERMLVTRGVPIPEPSVIEERRERLLKRLQSNPDHRPTMLVCVEWFTSLHAMYRCYVPIMRQLRQRFRLVAMSRAMDIDEIGKAEFDEWHEVSADNLVIEGLFEKINSIEPDVIFHPSLGMALWWVILASTRMAPVQMMMLGHPSSSQSKHMDYVFCEEGSIGDPSLYTEKIVEYPEGSARFVMRHDAQFPEIMRRDPSPDVVKLAIPAMLCKLNAKFVAALVEIQKRARKKVEFHFFVNMIGLNLYQSAQELRDALPTAKVYERNHYVGYIEHLSQCHIHLSTFPFGGTNSNIDSMKCGLPIVTLWGDETFERYDGMMMRRVGMPEWLIAKSVEEYIASAVALIDDDHKRNLITDQLLATDIDAKFFGDPPAGQETAVVDLVWNTFKEHKA